MPCLYTSYLSLNPNSIKTENTTVSHHLPTGPFSQISLFSLVKDSKQVKEVRLGGFSRHADTAVASFVCQMKLTLSFSTIWWSLSLKALKLASSFAYQFCKSQLKEMNDECRWKNVYKKHRGSYISKDDFQASNLLSTFWSALQNSDHAQTWSECQTHLPQCLHVLRSQQMIFTLSIILTDLAVGTSSCCH